MPISPTLIAALAAGALAAPIAQAKPSDVYTPVAEAAARAQSKQHQRAPHAGDAIKAPGATVVDSASVLTQQDRCRLGASGDIAQRPLAGSPRSRTRSRAAR